MVRVISKGLDEVGLATKLVSGFAEALEKLIPYFDQAGIRWKDGEQYDNYDRIADVLFRELVMNPLTYELLGEERSYQYDMPPYEAPWGGVRVLDRQSGDDLGMLMRVTSITRPMDGVTYMRGFREERSEIETKMFELSLKD